MPRYHIGRNGKPALCGAATQGSCPLGGQHFASKDQADFYVENVAAAQGVTAEALATAKLGMINRRVGHGAGPADSREMLDALLVIHSSKTLAAALVHWGFATPTRAEKFVKTYDFDAPKAAGVVAQAHAYMALR